MVGGRTDRTRPEAHDGGEPGARPGRGKETEMTEDVQGHGLEANVNQSVEREDARAE